MSRVRAPSGTIGSAVSRTAAAARGTPRAEGLRAEHAALQDPVEDVDRIVPAPGPQPGLTRASTLAFVQQRDSSTHSGSGRNGQPSASPGRPPGTHTTPGAPSEPDGHAAAAAAAAYQELNPVPTGAGGHPRPQRPRPGGPGLSAHLFDPAEALARYASHQSLFRQPAVRSAWLDWSWWTAPVASPAGTGGSGPAWWATTALMAWAACAILAALTLLALWNTSGAQRVAVAMVSVPWILALAAIAVWATGKWHRQRARAVDTVFSQM